MAWTYNATNYDPNRAVEFELIPAGKHRVRIYDTEELVSKNGRDMVKITFDVSGYNGKLFHYLVFLEENPQFTDQKIGEIYNSFGIKFTAAVMPKTWIGKVGAVSVRHEQVDDKTYAKIAWFIKRDLQDDLPKWVEGAGPSHSTSAVTEDRDYDEAFDTLAAADGGTHSSGYQESADVPF